MRRKKQRIKPAYFLWRDGRPRWEPGPALFYAGWQARDLKDAQGQFLPKGPAIDAAELINKEMYIWRAGAKLTLPPIARREGQPAPGPGKPRPGKKSRSLRTLGDLYFESSRARFVRRSGKPKSAKTIRGYKGNFNMLPQSTRDCDAAEIDRPALELLYETMMAISGVSQANAIFRVLSVVLSYGVTIGWVEINRLRGFEKQGLPARLRLILPGEADALIAACETLQLHHVGDALFLGLHTAQRWGDVCAMPTRIIADGKVRLSQMKTGALLDIDLTPALKARLDQRNQRLADAGIISPIIVCDELGRNFEAAVTQGAACYENFNRDFRAVRQLAEQTVASCKDILFKDTRDTAITRLSLAECSIIQIASVSGHSLKSIHNILRHYLVMTPEMANEAIRKLVTYLEKEDIGV